MTPNPNLQLISTQIDVQKLPPFFQHGLLVTDNPVSADMLMIAMLTATSSVLPTPFSIRCDALRHTSHHFYNISITLTGFLLNWY